MNNQFLRTVCAAWLGAALAACGATQDDAASAIPSKDADVQAALAQLHSARVVGSDGEVPYFIEGDFGRVSQVSAMRARQEPGSEVREVLGRVAPVFRLSESELVFRHGTTDARGHRHLRFQQTRMGREVVGAQLVLHHDAEGVIYAANGTARGGAPESDVATVAAEAAVKVALEDAGVEGARAVEPATLAYLRPEGSEALRLVWKVLVEGERQGMPARDYVYVDALRGGLQGVHPLFHSAMNRRVYSANNGTSTPGTLKRSEGQAATGDAHVDMNYEQLGVTYNCYKELFGRDSYDNSGATLTSTVHYGRNYVNAYWDGTQMVYGDGDGVNSIELGKDLDVTVHELTHAVTDSESDLIYAGESGGLNESMSDIFAGVCESWSRGWAVDTDVFLIGEDIWTPGVAGDALRYMHDPAKDGISLDFYGDYYPGVDVHYSSGISNLVFALLSTGGTHPRGKTSNAVAAIGPEKAGRIFYKANTDYFTPSTTFEQAKTYTVQAAQALGYDAATVQVVTDAWLAVGVPPPPPVTTPLTNNEPLGNLSGSTGSKKYYTLEVPEGQPSLTFNLSGGSGDADLYVRYGAAPSSSSYDCRPYKAGNVEACTFTNPEAGTWYVMVHAYSSYSGVTLKGAYSGGSDGGGDTGTPVTETASGTVRKNKTVQVGSYNVVAGTPFSVTMTGSGNADLYVRFGSQPTTNAYDCRSNASGSTESCTLTVPSGQSRAYVMVRGVGNGNSRYNLTINYTRP